MTIDLIFENYPEPNITKTGFINASIPLFLRYNNQYKICDIEHIYTRDNWVYPIAIINPILEKYMSDLSYLIVIELTRVHIHAHYKEDVE